MTASGLRTSLPRARRPLSFAVMGLVAVGLLLTGFAIGSWRATSQLAAQPAVVAPSAATVIPAIPVAPVVPVSGVRPVPESVLFFLQGPAPARTAPGPALERSAPLAPCSPGTVIADNMGVLAHGPDCTIITGQRPADEGIDVITHGPQPAAAPVAATAPPALQPGFHP